MSTAPADPILAEALAVAGSGIRLARLLGVDPQTVSNWRRGVRPIPPSVRGLVAVVGSVPRSEWPALLQERWL